MDTATPSLSDMTDLRARQKMSTSALLVRIMASVAPATVIVGIIPMALAVTGMLAVPAAIIVIGLILMLWTPGYVAMARHVSLTGTFAAYITAGLGRPLGAAFAVLSLLAYFGFVAGSAAAVGGFGAEQFSAVTGVGIGWPLVALTALAFTWYLGVREARISGRVLAVLLIAELAYMLVVDALILANGSFHPSMASLDVTQLLHPGVGALAAIAVTTYAGYEQGAAWLSQVRHGARTVGWATVTALVLIVVSYAGSAWIMISSGGPGIVDAASSDAAATLYFDQVGAAHVGWVTTTGLLLLTSSTYAAWLAFGPVLDRCIDAQAVTGLLPRTLATDGPVPRRAAHLRTAATFLVIVAAYLLRVKPTDVFYWGGATGGSGVLLLITATAVAIVIFFAREHHDVPVVQRLFAPVLSAAALLIICYFALTNLDILYGNPDAARIVSFIAVAVFTTGLLRAVQLRITHSAAYDRLAGIPPAATPRHAAVGRHETASSTVLGGPR